MATSPAMPARKAFWNALLVVFIPVAAALGLVVHFFSPQEPQEWLGVTIVLTIIFGIPGVLLFALLYRRYRHPAPSSERFALGFLQIFIAVAGLVALAKDPTKHTWNMLVSVLFLGWFGYRGVVLILDRRQPPVTLAGDRTEIGDR